MGLTMRYPKNLPEFILNYIFCIGFFNLHDILKFKFLLVQSKYYSD